MSLRRFAPITAAAALAATALLTGCGEAPTVSAVPGGIALPAGLLTEIAADEATGVGELCGTVKDGDVVVAHGWVGGRAEPIAANAAIFSLAGAKAGCTKSCCAGKDDPPMLVVEITGEDGRPLALNLADAAGLEPNSEVIVKGRVAGDQTGDAPLVIRAESMHVVPATAEVAGS